MKTLSDDYKLTLNDPDPIDDFLEIHFSHKDNRELHMMVSRTQESRTSTSYCRYSVPTKTRFTSTNTKRKQQ
jgi:hypothetical protein